MQQITMRDLSTTIAEITSHVIRHTTLLYPALLSPHSHSIVLSHGNALIWQCEFFLRTLENQLCDPSEICALDFKREFRRFGIGSVSATIDNNRSIFDSRAATSRDPLGTKKRTVKHGRTVRTVAPGIRPPAWRASLAV